MLTSTTDAIGSPMLSLLSMAEGASGIATMPPMLVDSQSMVVYNGRCSRRKLRKLTLAEESANSLANSSVLAGLLTNKKLENFG
jgi:hypothetical protein